MWERDLTAREQIVFMGSCWKRIAKWAHGKVEGAPPGERVQAAAAATSPPSFQQGCFPSQHHCQMQTAAL